MSGYELKTAVRLPLTGTAPILTRFPEPVDGTMATLRSRLRAAAKAVEAPTVPPQTFPLVSYRLSGRTVRAIANVATSAEPEVQLLKRERLDLEQYVGLVYTAFVIVQYQEAKALYEEARRAARKLDRRKRSEAEEEIREGFEVVVKEALSALELADCGASHRDLDRMSRDLSSDESAYQTILQMRDSAQGTQIEAPTELYAEIIPVTSAELLGTKAILDLELFGGDWCGFEPMEGVRTAHFNTDISWDVKIPYICGVKTCGSWPFKVPCGFDWCSTTVTLAAVSVALSFDVGYKIDCCGATAWGSGEVEVCGSILGLTECATCEAHIAGVLGMGKVTTSGGKCGYGVGLTAGVSCKVAGYTVFSGNLSYGWVIEGACPPPAVLEALCAKEYVSTMDVMSQ